jgi:hypothetical protein
MKLKYRGALIRIKRGREEKYPIQRLNLGLYLRNYIHGLQS